MSAPVPVATQAYALERPAPRSRPKVAWKDASGAHAVVLDRSVACGSAKEAALVIDDRTVSRLHAELAVENDGLWVKDLGSRNGTYVNGIKVGAARVPQGGVLRLGAVEIQVAYLAPEEPSDLWPEASFGPLYGRTAVMREVFALIAKYGRTAFSVLVTGETGTGKELVARALHDASAAASGPFVVVDCASLPDTLLESELFGHARGAFTGALATRIGAFEAAHGGTIFIDEIGELPLALQPKLLRVLESRAVRRVGESEWRPIDVRVVSATHRDLRTMVSRGAFREDLYFRLAVLPIHLPPLRDRAADIPLLLDRFLAPSPPAIAPELLADLARRPWPGNVRELRNFAQRLGAMGIEAAMASLDGTADAPAPSIASPADADGAALARDLTRLPFKEFRERWIEEGERAYVRRALAENGNNGPAAARASGLERTYFFRLTKKLGL